MSKDSYGVNPVNLKEVDNFEVLILMLPENEIDDKLTYLTREKGKISRSFYEDFVIANCVANINQLLSHINQNLGNSPDLLKIRAELMDSILKYNSQLAPDNLIINKNYVVKIKKFKRLKDGEKYIVENSSWDTSYYENPDDDKRVLSTITKDKEKDIEHLKNKAKGKIKDIDELEYDVKQVWWKRIGQYIDIKQFKKDDMIHILKKRYFHSPTSFNTFIVSVCVVGFEDLFMLLDNMGIPSKVAPPILMNELYELCRSLNKFLTYNNAQEVSDDPNNVSESGKGKKSPKTTTAGLMHNYGNTKTKTKFKDVPKEDLLKLGDNMKVSLIGQDSAVDTLVDTIQRAKIGLKDPVKPIGSFLFAGRTGVGKTLGTKVLADELIKSRDNLITIDCSEYSADHEYSKLIGCFVPGSKVLMDGGSVKNIEEIKVGEKVVTHKGRKKKVQYVHEYEQDGDMVRFITANSNIPVTTTKTHEILAIRGDKCQYTHRKHVTCKPTCSKKDCTDKLYKKYEPEWVSAVELKENDILLYPRYKSTGKYPNKLDLADYLKGTTRYKYDDEYIWAQEHVKVHRFIEVGRDLARLAGYYVSEGGSSIAAKSINFTFHSKEVEYIIEVVKLVRRLFGDDVRIRIEDRTEHNSYRIWVSSRVICNFMSELFGHNTYVKHVPAWFCEMPDDLIRQFLETAVFGDGCLTIKRRMDYSTVSADLLYQMESLFRQLGYITYKQLHLSSKPNCADNYRLYISGNQVERLNMEFNFNLNLAEMKQTDIQRKAWIDDDYLYLQIKKIEHVGYTGKVYDLAVEDDVSYITEIIVHNSPAGYIGHEQGGNLTNAINKNPFSVIVFDEVEKASSKVHELMLQILEEGRLTDGQGKAASFKDAIIIMTSNVGASEIDAIGKTIGFGDANKITDGKKDVALNEALKKKFKPEFLNRIDSIINFKTLIKKDYMKIIDIELYKLETNLKNNDTDYKDLVLEFDKSVKNFVYKHGIDEKYGARPLKRCIEQKISTPLSKKILQEDIGGDSVILVSVKRGKIIFDVSEKVEELPFYMSDGYQVANGV